MKEKYGHTYQDFCPLARKFQSMASFDECHAKNPDIPHDAINNKRLDNKYVCPDEFQMGSIQDNRIYIATTDQQHDQIVHKEHIDANGGLSGCFSDQDTIDACRNGTIVDNKKYNEMSQIAPYREGGINGIGNAEYKPHLDCFEIDREALRKNYQTDDFNAAIAKCRANNQFGSGGGNQGYNPYIAEMIENGTLKHVPENSFTDYETSKSQNKNGNQLINSVVPEDEADLMYASAYNRAKDCVNNNTPHPSSKACSHGFSPTNSPVESNTGNAIPIRNSEQQPNKLDNQHFNPASAQDNVSRKDGGAQDNSRNSLAPPDNELQAAQNKAPDLSGLFSKSAPDTSKEMSSGMGTNFNKGGIQ